MENPFQLTTTDGHTLYGKINSQSPSDKVIVFVHGLTGNLNEHHYFNAAPFFTKAGFDTCRFNFYDYSVDARTLTECFISQHSMDLSLVLDHIQKSYKTIYLVGHSLAGPVILGTEHSCVDRVVLWDPTSGLSQERKSEFRYLKELDAYLNRGRLDILMGKQMIEEWEQCSDLEAELQKIQKPTHFIFAGKHHNAEKWIPVMEKNPGSYSYETIVGATHGFAEEGLEEDLFTKTLNFIKMQ